MINIRQATANHSHLLSSLCVDVQRLHIRHQPHIFKPPINADFAVSYFDEMLAAPGATIFIAEEDGEARDTCFAN
jgi:hypothetical protein